MNGFKTGVLHINPKTGEVVCEGDRAVRLWVAIAKKEFAKQSFEKTDELRRLLQSASIEWL